MDPTFQPYQRAQARPVSSARSGRAATPRAVRRARPPVVDHLLAAAGEYPACVIRDSRDLPSFPVDLPPDAERTVSDTAETHPRLPLTEADAEAVLSLVDRMDMHPDRTEEIAIENVLEEIFIEPSSPPPSTAAPPSQPRTFTAPAHPTAPAADVPPAPHTAPMLQPEPRPEPRFFEIPAPPPTVRVEQPPPTLRAEELPISVSTPTPPPMVLPLVAPRNRHPELVEVAPPVAVTLPRPEGLPILPRTSARTSRAPLVVATAAVLALLGVAAAFACYVFLPSLLPDEPQALNLPEGGWTHAGNKAAAAPLKPAPQADKPASTAALPRAELPVVAVTKVAPIAPAAPTGKAEAEPVKAPSKADGVPTLSVESLPSAPPNKGVLAFAPAASGHRIWVDGALVGDGRQTLPCGLHSVKVGSAGRARTVNVPCGGEVTVEP